jgi:hypothetical protein
LEVGKEKIFIKFFKTSVVVNKSFITNYSTVKNLKNKKEQNNKNKIKNKIMIKMKKKFVRIAATLFVQNVCTRRHCQIIKL